MSGWGFHSFIGAVEAEKLLLEKGCHGSFICRRSGTTPGGYTLSVRRDNVVRHYKIQNDDDVFHLYDEDGFASVPELIDYYKKNPSQFLDENHKIIELGEPVFSEGTGASLEHESWFYGSISKDEAVDLLTRNGVSGSYLIRESRTRPGSYVLSVKKNDSVIEFLISHDKRGYDIGSGKRIGFKTLHQLLDHYRKNPVIHAQTDEVMELKEPLSVTTERKRNDALIKAEFEQLQKEDKVNTSRKIEGARPENKKKNRYKNILPLDKTRVRLKNVDPDIIGSDYINASYVTDRYTGRVYIAAQGCMKATVHDFWQMVFEQNSRVIVMLTKEIEVAKIKCVKYWPDSGSSLFYDDKQITNILETNTRDYCVRELLVSKVEANPDAPVKPPRKIFHFQFLEWPDHGVPADPGSLLEMLQKCNAAQMSFSNPGPIVIHCSAGIGRTGTVLALDILLNHLMDKGNLNSVNVPDVVKKIRMERSGMIQTEMQYRFLYVALQHHIDIKRKIIASSMDDKTLYGNMKELSSRTLPRLPSLSYEPSPPDRTVSLDRNRNRTGKPLKNR